MLKWAVLSVQTVEAVEITHNYESSAAVAAVQVGSTFSLKFACDIVNTDSPACCVLFG